MTATGVSPTSVSLNETLVVEAGALVPMIAPSGRRTMKRLMAPFSKVSVVSGIMSGRPLPLAVHSTRANSEVVPSLWTAEMTQLSENESAEKRARSMASNLIGNFTIQTSWVLGEDSEVDEGRR